MEQLGTLQTSLTTDEIKSRSRDGVWSNWSRLVNGSQKQCQKLSSWAPLATPELEAFGERPAWAAEFVITNERNIYIAIDIVVKDLGEKRQVEVSEDHVLGTKASARRIGKNLLEYLGQ